MNFYSFDEIRQRGSCIRFVEEVLGERIVDGRCRAVWRNGTNPQSVSVKETEWYDHSRKEGGGIIELCSAAKFGNDVQQTQDWLGSWLGLTPTMGMTKAKSNHFRYDKLIAEGFKETAKYFYTDEDGTARVHVIRMEHPEKKKEFVQETPNGVRPKDVEQVLYNLPVIAKSPWAVIVEGEKDAETLIKWNLPGTTCIGGSKKWHESYNRYFKDKEVVICRDNDEAGLGHAKMVAKSLVTTAKTIRMICPSVLPKGDVTKWAIAEGGTKEKFLELMKKTVPMSHEEAMWDEDEILLLRAKEANAKPLANTHTETHIIDGKDKRVEVPYTMNELTVSVHERFLGFPRRLGDTRMFDHDKDSGRIEFLDNKSALLAWASMKSKKVVHWARVSGAIGKDELYEGLIQNAIRYESISHVPDYPRRADVYYAYRDKIKPSEGNQCFNRLMEFFHPANDASRILLRALFAAPIYYRYGVRRPCWIIDSEAGQGVGKSTVAELLGTLYRCAPIKTSKQELKFDFKELLKRVVSSEGRSSRILIVDNVTGTFNDSNFSAMVTDFGISGKAPYGRGEETRPNNLTYIITSNSANVDNDMASRFFGIMLAKPVYDANWTKNVMEYIEKYRYTIFGDIIQILTSETESIKPSTRIPEFEQEVLWPMCANKQEYDTAISGIIAQREEANVEGEQARQCEEIIGMKLEDLMPGERSSHMVAFIRYEIIDEWLSTLRPVAVMQDVRNFAKVGQIKCINKDIRRYPNTGTGPNASLRSTGLMWIGEHCTKSNFEYVLVVGRGNKNGTKSDEKARLQDNTIRDMLPDYIEAEVESVKTSPMQSKPREINMFSPEAKAEDESLAPMPF